MTPKLLVALKLLVTMRIRKIQEPANIRTFVRNGCAAETALIFAWHKCSMILTQAAEPTAW